VANLNSEDLRRLARLGAVARLEQIRAEEAMIRSEVPELFGGGGSGAGRGRKRAAATSEAQGASGSGGGGRQRRRRQRQPMSAAQRKAVSERMRRYWAERRKAKAGK
jgi:hypothetical protein